MAQKHVDPVDPDSDSYEEQKRGRRSGLAQKINNYRISYLPDSERLQYLSIGIDCYDVFSCVIA
jgi:hypothetical protein